MRGIDDERIMIDTIKHNVILPSNVISYIYFYDVYNYFFLLF